MTLVMRPAVSCTLGLVLSAAPLAATALASVIISADPTKHMSCAAGVCSPTSTSAVLNASSLESMLASGNLTVTTSGSGNVQANDIVVADAFTWSSSSGLTLTAAQSITFDAPVSVTGKGGLTFNDAGKESLAFHHGANVKFSKLSSALTINGNAYALVDTVTGFASAVSANENGYFALAASYDASRDGAYSSAPVQGDNANGGMNGVFEGLGNSISNLTIVDGTSSGGCDGLIANAPQETISNFGMVNISITSTGDQGANGAGGIVCGINSNGLIWRSYATGTITMGRLDGAGGLDAGNAPIVQSWANVSISGGQGSTFGGLTTGGPDMLIQQSFSVGPVSCTVGFCQLGGLSIGADQGVTITDSYSLGSVKDGGPGGDDSSIGGLLSNNGEGTITDSYAAGSVSGPDSGCAENADCAGGLYGVDNYNSNADVYWDKTTALVNVAAGNESSDPGTKGLTNKQLTTKLPKGFSKKIWAQSPKVNNGLPYLIANPPQN